ncbi:MAG: hypothetical protein JWQ23_2574, partial [Herminiimonas sp.]|nr:hypothetical protein [Herminiimonas sp.]
MLIASAILHLVIIGWVSDSITLPSQSLQSQAPIIAQLRTEQPVVEAPIAKPVPPPPKPAVRPKPRRRASA